MSENDDLKKQFETAIARLASLEAEVSGYRSRKHEPEKPTFDPVAYRQAFLADPIGSLTRMGAPVDHITKVLVAHALGDNAPPELKVLASMGPQVSAQHALDAKVETLSRQLSALTTSGSRDKFRSLAKDASKYPNLSKMLETDPSFFDDEISDGANVEEFAKGRESRMATAAKAFGPKTPPASDANADETAQSTQGKPAIAGAISGDPPPLPRGPSGVFTQEDHQKLRDEVVRKYSS